MQIHHFETTTDARDNVTNLLFPRDDAPKDGDVILIPSEGVAGVVMNKYVCVITKESGKLDSLRLWVGSLHPTMALRHGESLRVARVYADVFEKSGE